MTLVTEVTDILASAPSPSPDIMQDVVAVYTDGGVIRRNPSPYGGTWAWIGVNGLNDPVAGASGVLPAPVDILDPYTGVVSSKPVGNNVAEFLAVVEALEALPRGWSGYVYSDSEITLRRIFGDPPAAWRYLPAEVAKRCYRALCKLSHIVPVLVSGHPNKAELAAGHTLDGRKRLVSAHNVAADRLCRQAGEEYLASLAKKKG